MIDEKKLIEELCNQYQKYNLDTWNEAIDRAIQIVESQPKISLENKTSDNMHCACSGQVWIPVSENLPEEENEQYISVGSIEGNDLSFAGTGIMYSDLVMTTCRYKGEEETFILDLYTKEGIWQFDGFESPYDIEVLAWMPLPLPYKALQGNCEVQDETIL